jgi:hypothetical protein
MLLVWGTAVPLGMEGPHRNFWSFQAMLLLRMIEAPLVTEVPSGMERPRRNFWSFQVMLLVRSMAVPLMTEGLHRNRWSFRVMHLS